MENVMGKLEEKLSAPSSEYRSVPFWSWNDELDLNELQWQIHEMKEKNFIYYELNTSVLEDIMVWLADLKGDHFDEDKNQ